MNDEYADLTDAELEDYLKWIKKQDSTEFHRIDERKTKLKRKLDCGHWIDGSEPYRYQVWKHSSEDGIGQRTDCEFCARQDASY